MTRFFLSLLLAFLTAPAFAEPPAARPKYVIESEDTRRVSAELNWEISCPGLKANDWTLYAAAAPELPSQAKAKTTMSPPAVRLKNTEPVPRPVLMSRVFVRHKEQESKLSAKVTYEATLRSRSLKELAADAPVPKVEFLTAAEKKAYLADRGDLDFKEQNFQSWLTNNKLRREPGESEVDFGRRVFLKIKELGTYDYKPNALRHASTVCDSCKTDCGGLSVLFASAMRANGIPARTLFGRWAESAKKDEKLAGVEYLQWHVKAEFYAENVGWVPVDLALAVLYDKAGDGLKNFGHDSGKFLTMHVDPNFEIDAGRFGTKKIQYMQTLSWLASGDGTTDGSKVVEGWKVKELK